AIEYRQRAGLQPIGPVRRSDLLTGEMEAVFQFEHDPNDISQRYQSSDFAISPDSRLLVMGEEDKEHANVGTKVYERFLVAETRTGRQVAKVSVSEVTRFAFTLDARYFITTGAGGIDLWETASWHKAARVETISVNEIKGASPLFFAVALSPDGRTL